MLKIFHAKSSRSLRVVWLCEEMGLKYETAKASIREPSPEFIAANPLRTMPVLKDGDMTMIESVAIMNYIMHRYGPTALNVIPTASNYGAYQQFLMFGEAGLSMLLNVYLRSRFLAPAGEKENFGAKDCLDTYLKRLEFVGDHVKDRLFVAGDDFTAADISVGYALGFGDFLGLKDRFPAPVAAYHDRLIGRPAYQRAAAVE